MDLASRHRIWMAGRDTGEIPFRINSLAARLFLQRLVFRVIFHRLLTVRTALGRKARVIELTKGGPLIRTRSTDLAAAGVARVPRVVGARHGLPLLEDGRTIDAANIVWCSGFSPGLSWIDLPIFDAAERPNQDRGVVPAEPGLYFVGLKFLFAFSSTMIHGVGRDADRIAAVIDSRVRVGYSMSAPSAVGRENAIA
jgi:putative flavoprotein involved in K+ transport